MEYIAQFAITFALGWIAIYSTKRWTSVVLSIFGILAIPVLIIMFFAGDESAFWQTLGSGLGLLLEGALNGLGALFKTAPVMTVGAVIGGAVAIHSK